MRGPSLSNHGYLISGGSYANDHDARTEIVAILTQTEPALYVPGHEGREHLRTTKQTRDYAAYGVSHAALEDALYPLLEAPDFEAALIAAQPWCNALCLAIEEVWPC